MLKQPLTRSLAWRFMIKSTTKGKLSILTLLSWIAIAVGVGVMGGLLSIMYGLETSLKKSILRSYPHVFIKPKVVSDKINNHQKWTDALQKLPEVSRVVPYVESEMIAQSQNRTLGVVVHGVPKDELERLNAFLVQGKSPLQGKMPQGILGVELAHHLGLQIDETFLLVSPFKRSGAMGVAPEATRFEMSGVFSTGHYDFDKQAIYLSLEEAQFLLQKNTSISGWQIWLKNESDAEDFSSRLVGVLPEPWQAQSWQVFNGALFQSLKLEQIGMAVILGFAILIAALNISITLLMNVNNKKSNIGILRAMGLSSYRVQNIFLWQGVWTGVVGLLGGALLAFIIIFYAQNFYEFPEIYYVRNVPVEIRPWSLATIYISASFLILIGTLYPAYRASQIHPIEAIRNV